MAIEANAAKQIFDLDKQFKPGEYLNGDLSHEKRFDPDKLIEPGEYLQGNNFPRNNRFDHDKLIEPGEYVDKSKFRDNNFDPDKLIEPQDHSVEKSSISDGIDSNEQIDVDSSIKDKIQSQNEEISNVENGIKTLDNTLEKGNYGEMKADQELRELGWERISTEMVTDIDDMGHQGIDGVYKNSDGKFLILEVKYGYAQLSPTLDGMQMSDNWIDKRLDDAVGKTMADQIRLAMLSDPNNVYRVLARVDENGKVAFCKLDNNANIIERNVKIND